VAHDHRRRSHPARKLADQSVHDARVRTVELARRLVREEQPGAVRERRAEGDALLLPARELARKRVAAVRQPDALEELVRARVPVAGRRAGEAELEADELPRRELLRECAPVVLLRVAERARAVLGEPTAAQPAQVDAEGAGRPGGGSVEAGEDPEQRRLPRPARAEDDADLARAHVQRQTLERSHARSVAGVDAEDVPELERRAHAPASDARTAGTGARNARAVASATSAPASAA
jgi:hypothetical protein